jgi:hypothetical protein
VGATLFYLLCGRAPFEQANVIKLVAKILEQLAFCVFFPLLMVVGTGFMGLMVVRFYSEHPDLLALYSCLMRLEAQPIVSRRLSSRLRVVSRTTGVSQIRTKEPSPYSSDLAITARNRRASKKMTTCTPAVLFLCFYFFLY